MENVKLKVENVSKKLNKEMECSYRIRYEHSKWSRCLQ